jgi:hypothetical protein
MKDSQQGQEVKEMEEMKRKNGELESYFATNEQGEGE